MAEDKASNNDTSKGRELSAMLSRHNREMADLEELLRSKQRQIDELSSQVSEQTDDLKRQLREKEEELEIFKAGMDEVLLEFNAPKAAVGLPTHLWYLWADHDQETHNDAELVDSLLLEHLKRLNEIIGKPNFSC
jgi:TolA-binding protein